MGFFQVFVGFSFLLGRSEEKVNKSARCLKRLEWNGVSDQETYLQVRTGRFRLATDFTQVLTEGC